VIGASIGTAAVCYEVLGIIGYLTFGSNVGSNIIAMYPPTSLIIALGRLGIVLLVGLSYPLQCLPCRLCVHLLTKGLLKGNPHAKPLTGFEAEAGTEQPEGEGDEDEDSPLVPKALDSHGMPADEMSQNKFIIITTAILITGFIIALSVDELEIVLGFVGSTGSTILSFILPGFFYFRLWRKEEGSMKWFALALGIYGLAVMGFCLTFNIIHTVRHEGPSGH